MSPGALVRWRRTTGKLPSLDHPRPASRADCRRGPRPCPFVGCRHHLYLEVKPSGAITVAWPHLAPWEIPETCALEVAEGGEHTLDEIGELLNLSCERVRKIERQALARLREGHSEELARLWRGEVADILPAAEATGPPEANGAPDLASNAGGC